MGLYQAVLYHGTLKVPDTVFSLENILKKCIQIWCNQF